MAFDLGFSFRFHSFKWFTYIVKGIFNPFLRLILDVWFVPKKFEKNFI